MTVRELFAGETMVAADALLCLREAVGPAERIVARIDELQRPEGYRLAASFDEEGQAVAAGGFRVGHNLAWGRFLYIDDLITLPEARGHATALLRWIFEEAVHLGCDQGPSRFGNRETRRSSSLSGRGYAHQFPHFRIIYSLSTAGAEQASTGACD